MFSAYVSVCRVQIATDIAPFSGTGRERERERERGSDKEAEWKNK
jgi:hypothetical protein